MLKAVFEVKGDKKEVNVDFFVKDYTFINHLKRNINTQIKGSVQKNTILHLINKGNFIVLNENNELLFEGASQSTYNDDSGITYTNADIPEVLKLNVTSDLNSIDSICFRLDEIEDEATSLHKELQRLFEQENKLLEDKLIA